MLGQYTFGLKSVPYTDLIDDGKYFGNAVGGKTAEADAGYIDLNAAHQMYSLKARFTVYCLKDVVSAGTKGKVTVTPTVITAGVGVFTLKIGGEAFAFNMTATEDSAADFVTAVKAQITNYNLGNWTLLSTSTSTLIFEQVEPKAYTYAAADWAGSFVAGEGSSAAYSSAAASTTTAVAPAPDDLTFVLRDSADGETFTDLVSTKVVGEALIAQNTPVIEFTVPSNCKRYLDLKITAEADAASGEILCAIEPKN